MTTSKAMTVKAQLSGRPRKFVRVTHVAVSAGWLGLVVAMLTLGISAATASHPTFVLACYAMMERIGGAVIPFFAVATLLTGIVLSVATPWQLFRPSTCCSCGPPPRSLWTSPGAGSSGGNAQRCLSASRRGSSASTNTSAAAGSCSAS